MRILCQNLTYTPDENKAVLASNGSHKEVQMLESCKEHKCWGQGGSVEDYPSLVLYAGVKVFSQS